MFKYWEFRRRICNVIRIKWKIEEFHLGESHGIFQQKRTPHRRVHLTYSRGRQTGREWTESGLASPSMDVGHLLLTFPLQQLPDVLSNYIKEQASTEEVTLEDCAVGEWIFQGNRRLSTLDLGHVHGDHSTFSASCLYFKTSRWRIGSQEEALCNKNVHFTQSMSHNATNFDPSNISPKILFVNLCLLQVGGWTMLVVVQGDPLLLSTTVVGLDILAPRHPKLHALLINRLGFQLSPDSRGGHCFPPHSCYNVYLQWLPTLVKLPLVVNQTAVGGRYAALSIIWARSDGSFNFLSWVVVSISWPLVCGLYILLSGCASSLSLPNWCS